MEHYLSLAETEKKVVRDNPSAPSPRGDAINTDLRCKFDRSLRRQVFGSRKTQKHQTLVAGGAKLFRVTTDMTSTPEPLPSLILLKTGTKNAYGDNGVQMRATVFISCFLFYFENERIRKRDPEEQASRKKYLHLKEIL